MGPPRGIDPLTHRTMSGRKELIHNFAKNEIEMFYLTTHSTHFIYGYMASDMC